MESHVTTVDLNRKFKNFGKILIPAGTTVSNFGVLGYNAKVWEVSCYGFIFTTKHQYISSRLYDECRKYGIQIPKKYVKRVEI